MDIKLTIQSPTHLALVLMVILLLASGQSLAVKELWSVHPSIESEIQHRLNWNQVFEDHAGNIYVTGKVQNGTELSRYHDRFLKKINVANETEWTIHFDTDDKRDS